MLLAIDIGNTNIVLGLFEGRTLKGHWRLATVPSKTADEYGIECLSLMQAEGYHAHQVTGIIVSSVVPAVSPVFTELSEHLFHHPPLIVSHDLPSGLTIRYPNPHEIGSDRLVNAAGAYARFRTWLIIIDFGTATTFCAVTAAGEYLGGAIAPGIGIAAEALSQRTAKLPNVELVRPKGVIGVDTTSSIQSGLIFGFVGLVDEMVRRMQSALGHEATVIATGGFASLIASESQTIQKVCPHLTLEGLELLYRLSRGE